MIVDASVVAKWFLKGEEWEEKALKLKELYEEGEIGLKAPSLVLYEVGNVIWKRRDMPSELAEKFVEKITEYLEKIIVELKPNIARKAIRIAKKENITFYDAIYIALSDMENELLVTADKKLYNKAKNNHLIKHVSET